MLGSHVSTLYARRRGAVKILKIGVRTETEKALTAGARAAAMTMKEARVNCILKSESWSQLEVRAIEADQTHYGMFGVEAEVKY